jgi:hypothetical protein
MTAVAWLRRTQLRLVLLAAARALCWAGAVLLGGLAAGAVLTALAAPPASVSASVRLASILAALATLGLLLWAARFVWSLPRVALWLEERLPELRYALVTAVDPRYATTFGPLVEPVLSRANPAAVIRRTARRSALPAVVALAVAALAFGAVPAGWRQRLAGTGFTGGPEIDTRPNRLESLRVIVTPPKYAVEAGVERQTLENPTTIAGLAGSTVDLSGAGAPDGVEVRLGEAAVAAAAEGDARWRAGFTLPDSATALRLADREYRRLIVLAPERDQPPTVQLLSPASDTTVREPAGSLTLDAQVMDDFGLSTSRFEYIVSSGESEGNFTSRDGMLGARRLRNDRDARLRLTVPLATFQLKPGDLLSVRAVAIDNNTLSGPDTGYSEPRTIRVARSGEYDSLAVEGAPPPADSALMTLRYLIQLSQDLHGRRAKLPRPQFVDSSTGLGIRAERLRMRVEQLQSDQTMGGMFPRNPLLNTAYLALAEGEGALKVAEPGEALPHLWTALRALQKYAWAERYYLRGRGGDVLVDLARVRLTGADTGHAGPRTPRRLADSTRTRHRAAYAEALGRLATSPDSTREGLTLLQVEALRADPALAGALGEAIAALQAGGDPARPLQQARRILDGPATVADTLPRWSGAW